MRDMLTGPRLVSRSVPYDERAVLMERKLSILRHTTEPSASTAAFYESLFNNSFTGFPNTLNTRQRLAGSAIAGTSVNSPMRCNQGSRRNSTSSMNTLSVHQHSPLHGRHSPSDGSLVEHPLLTGGHHHLNTPSYAYNQAGYALAGGYGPSYLQALNAFDSPSQPSMGRRFAQRYPTAAAAGVHPHLDNSLEDDPNDNDDLDSLADRLDGAMGIDSSPLRDMDLFNTPRRSLISTPPAPVNVRRCQSMRYPQRSTASGIKFGPRRAGDPIDWDTQVNSSNGGTSGGSSSSGESPTALNNNNNNNNNNNININNSNGQSSHYEVRQSESRRGSNGLNAISSSSNSSTSSSTNGTQYNSRSSFRRFGASTSNTAYLRRGSQFDSGLGSAASGVVAAVSGDGSNGSLNGSSGQLNQYVTFNRSNGKQSRPLSSVRLHIIDSLARFRVDTQTRLSRVHVLGHPTSGKSTLIQLFRHLQNECGNSDSQQKSQEHLSPAGSKMSIGFSSNSNGRDDNSDTVFLHLQESNLDLLHSKQQSNETLNGGRTSNGCSLQPNFDNSNDSGYLDVDSNSPFANYPADLYMVVYAVNDRESFEEAELLVKEVLKWDNADPKPIILVANKTDLVRSRVVSKQEGKQLAIDHHCKYVETSCAISHNVDLLLAGISAQINLRYNKGSKTGKKRSIIKRLLQKASLNKSKSCHNLHVL